MKPKILDLLIIRTEEDCYQSLGNFFINGIFFCTSYENKRNLGCAPAGKYKVSMNFFSPIFAANDNWESLTAGYVPKLEKTEKYRDFFITSAIEAPFYKDCIQICQISDSCPSNYSPRYVELYQILDMAKQLNKQIILTIK